MSLLYEHYAIFFPRSPDFTNGNQIVFKASWSSPTSDEVCAMSTSQYDPALYQVMVKDGESLGHCVRVPSSTLTNSSLHRMFTVFLMMPL